VIECLVLGDSIAVGVGQHLKHCVVDARVGISSRSFIKSHKIIPANSTIISLGSNDSAKTDSFLYLLSLRSNIKSKCVVWILPANIMLKTEDIKKIAEENGDIVLSIPFVNKDGIHPTSQGYKQLAREIGEILKDRI